MGIQNGLHCSARRASGRKYGITCLRRRGSRNIRFLCGYFALCDVKSISVEWNGCVQARRRYIRWLDCCVYAHSPVRVLRFLTCQAQSSNRSGMLLTHVHELLYAQIIYRKFSAAIPGIVYAFLGTSRQLNVAPEAALSLLVGEAVSDALHSDPHSHPVDPDAVGLAVSTIITFQVSVGDYAMASWLTRGIPGRSDQFPPWNIPARFLGCRLEPCAPTWIRHCCRHRHYDVSRVYSTCRRKYRFLPQCRQRTADTNAGTCRPAT